MANESRFCQNCNRDIAASNYALHSIHCERNIQLCNLCNEPFPKSEKVQHLEEFHSIETCKLCNTKKEKWLMPKHEEECIKRPVECNFCKLQLPLNDLKEHSDMCGARTEKCLVCNEYVMLKVMDRHRETCQNQSPSKFQGKCGYCDEIIPWIDMREHEASCRLSIYQSDDEDIISKSNTNHENQVAQKKAWQSDSRVQKKIEANPTIQKIKQCSYCKERFPDLIISSHLETCKERPFTCELCLMKFPFKDKMNHENMFCPMISGNDNCYAASGYTKSFEKKLKDCPYCKKKFPELMFKEHQDMCDESPYQCNLCLKAMALKEKTNHETKECKFKDKTRKPYINKPGSDRGYSFDIPAYSRQLEKKWKDCPYCEEKFSEMIFNDHLETCYERPLRCSLCSNFIPFKDKSYHDKFECKPIDKIQKQYSGSDRVHSKDVYSKDISAYSEQFEKDSLEFNHQSCPYCHRKMPSQRIAAHVQLCSESKTLCRFCGAAIPVDSETIHLQSCIGARHVVEDPVYQAPKEAEFQYGGSRKNKKNKNKKQQQTESSPQKTGFFTSFFQLGKDSNKKNYPTSIPQTVTHQFPQVVLLPCEFCAELFPEDLIIDHQSGCRPDLMSLPQNGTSPPTKLQYSNVHEAYRDRNAKVGVQPNINTYKGVENTGAKPKRYQISRKSSDVAPAEFLNKRLSPTKESDSGKDFFHSPGVAHREFLNKRKSPTNESENGKDYFHYPSGVAPGEFLNKRRSPTNESDSGKDYFHYPSGVPEHSFLMGDYASKKLHLVQDEEKDSHAVEEYRAQEMPVKNTKKEIFNFSASSNSYRNRSSASEDLSPLPRVSKYDFYKDDHNSASHRFFEDESAELKAVGAERAEKKGIIQVSQDTSMDSHGVCSEVSIGHDRRNLGSNAVSNEVYVEHNARNELSPSIQFLETSRNSVKKYENNCSQEKLNICFGEETSKVIESEKVKTTCAARLLGRLENTDFQANFTHPCENDSTEDDAKNAETFGNDYSNLDEKCNLSHGDDNFSDSGEHFYDAEDDFKVPSMEANDSASSSPNKDSNLEVYFQFLRKGTDELIGPNDMKNERTLTPEVESASLCECSNEICYCAISNRSASFENNNYLSKGAEHFKGTSSKGATPSVCLQRDLDSYVAFRTASPNSQCLEGSILGNEGQLNSLSKEVEKRTATWNEWRQSKSVETDSD